MFDVHRLAPVGMLPFLHHLTCVDVPCLCAPTSLQPGEHKILRLEGFLPMWTSLDDKAIPGVPLYKRKIPLGLHFYPKCLGIDIYLVTPSLNRRLPGTACMWLAFAFGPVCSLEWRTEEGQRILNGHHGSIWAFEGGQTSNRLIQDDSATVS